MKFKHFQDKTTDISSAKFPDLPLFQMESLWKHGSR